MSARHWLFAVSAGAALCACTVDASDGRGFGSATTPVVDGSAGDDEAESTGASGSTEPTSGGADSTTASDEASSSSAGTNTDAEDTTEGETTTSGTSDRGDGETPGDPLHPDLDVPSDGQSCQTPGSLAQCPALEVCRFHTSEQGLCEGCDACGNLGAICQSGTDCDILFACFQGRCTNICTLGTHDCGPIEACLDVGHPTHGVCDPFG